jgi:hypothetical protein
MIIDVQLVKRVIYFCLHISSSVVIIAPTLTGLPLSDLKAVIPSSST